MELDIWAGLGVVVALCGLNITFCGIMWQSIHSLRKEMNHRFDRQHDDHMNLVGVVAGLQVEVAELRGEMNARLDGRKLPAPAPSEK